MEWSEVKWLGETKKNRGSFPFVPPPPSLVGAYYLQPPDARAIFLHNDLLCNDTCSVTGGSITYWGGTNGKDPKLVSQSIRLTWYNLHVLMSFLEKNWAYTTYSNWIVDFLDSFFHVRLWLESFRMLLLILVINVFVTTINNCHIYVGWLLRKRQIIWNFSKRDGIFHSCLNYTNLLLDWFSREKEIWRINITKSHIEQRKLTLSNDSMSESTLCRHLVLSIWIKFHWETFLTLQPGSH